MSDELTDLDRDLLWHDSYERLPFLLDIAQSLPRDVFFQKLGFYWSMCDNIGAFRLQVSKILRSASRAELDLMMDESERTALAAMPKQITVFRGCYQVNRRGLSWTTDIEIAKSFPEMLRYKRFDDTPIVLSCTVNRDRAILKLDREEFEVIVTNPRNVIEVAP